MDPRSRPRSCARSSFAFPFAVARDCMTAIYTKTKDYHSQLEAWRAAVPNFLGGGVQIGMFFCITFRRSRACGCMPR